MNNIIYNYLESGYSNCSSLFDIGPYSKEYILDFLKTNMPKQIKDDNDAEKFYSLFDGNMSKITIFKNSLLTLNGFVLYFLKEGIKFKNL